MNRYQLSIDSYLFRNSLWLEPVWLGTCPYEGIDSHRSCPASSSLNLPFSFFSTTQTLLTNPSWPCFHIFSCSHPSLPFVQLRAVPSLEAEKSFDDDEVEVESERTSSVWPVRTAESRYWIVEVDRSEVSWVIERRNWKGERSDSTSRLRSLFFPFVSEVFV